MTAPVVLSANGQPPPAPHPAELLRFATAGSVDDGKSTLIGRLLYDSKSVLQDQLDHIADVSRRRGHDVPDLALLTDGLRAEREQGITIDVAHRYFATHRRRFIIADTPGHEQYTRNMVTGASNADVSVILVDARKGLVEQSRRHAFISSLLGVPHLVVCVNKMDLVGWDQDVFRRIRREFDAFAAGLDVRDVAFIPISALHGDNVVEGSAHMPWFDGPPLLTHLEEVEIATDRDLASVRFPVQWVIRPDGHDDQRRYAGQVAGGVLHPGDEVTVLPSGRSTRIAAVETLDGEVDQAFPPMSITLQLEHELDVSRGDMICSAAEPARESRLIEAHLCWMADEPLRPRGRYLLKHTTRAVKAVVDEIRSRVDIHTLDELAPADALELNDIGTVVLRTSAPLACDAYRHNRVTGSFVLIDEASNDTVAAGMVAATGD